MSETLLPSNHEQLGAFLRARRESIDFRLLGLTRYGRTRTPGLRREEVAQLAEIGVTWYTKLEQGRPIQVSAKTLLAIAHALQCTPEETQHIFILAGLKENSGKASPCESLNPEMQELLNHLQPYPAYIVNARFDMLGYNPAYTALIGVDIANLDSEHCNCLYLALTNSEWRERTIDYEELLPRMVAMFRSAMAGHEDDPRWKSRLQCYMNMSPVFQEIWQRYQVRGIENQLKRFKHPVMGVFTLQQTNWWSEPKGGNRMVVYLPVDDFGREVLDKNAAESATFPSMSAK